MIKSRLDEIFSRRMLGSVLVGLSASKVVESAVALLSERPVWEIVLWAGLFVLFVALFVYWERVAETAKEAGEKAKEAVEDQ